MTKKEFLNLKVGQVIYDHYSQAYGTVRFGYWHHWHSGRNGNGKYIEWHEDIGGTSKVGMSLQLSTERGAKKLEHFELTDIKSVT